MLFTFIIYPSREKALKNGRLKSKIFRKSYLNFTFGQGSCLISDFSRLKPSKAALLQISLRFDIYKNFAFFVAGLLESVMSSCCSMP